jgi:hypothetical protein
MITRNKQIQTALILYLVVIISGCSLDPDNNFNQGNGSIGKLRILFVGNSYTFTNDLPEIFVNIAKAGGHQVEIEMFADGGWTLSRHSQSNQLIKWIRRGTWDYVILQEHSLTSAKVKDREQSMYPAVRYLDSEVRDNGAKTILFMTWGYRDGLPKENFSNFNQMQAAITEGYQQIGDELDVMIAPVGIAWEIGVNESPQLDLWSKDGSHPNMKGSYLAACVFYATIYDESPKGIEYWAGLEEEIVHALQAIAERAVFN